MVSMLVFRVLDIDFLDIAIDLQIGKYKPFMKPNNMPLYVHKENNHPPSIIKNIPESINRRLSTISSNEEVFNEAAPAYKNALKSSGYEYQLKYEAIPDPAPNSAASRRRNRKRNFTW